MDDRVVGELGPLPAGVAVHRVVAAADGADPARLAQPAFELGDVAAAAVRQRVAAVGEGVEDEVGDALLGGQLDRRLEVLPAGVDAAVGDQAEQVEAAARAVRGPARRRRAATSLSKKVPSAIGVVDPGQVLLDDRAGAEVQVADLGVAHLPDRAGRRRGPGRRAGCAGSSPRGGRRPASRRARSALPGPGSARPQPSRMTRASEGTSVMTRLSGALRRSPRSPRRRARRRRPGRRRRRAGPAARRRCRA